MYGFYEHVNITIEQVLQKLTQKQIFEFALKHPLDFNRRYLSPFREDKKPGCTFTTRKDGTVLFLDFGDRSGKRHRSCFGYIMDLYKINLTDAIELICNHFNISKNSIDYDPVQPKLYEPTEQKERKPIEIPYDKKPYTKKDKIFWSQFLINVKEIEEDQVFSVERFKIISETGTRIITPYNDDPCYAIDFIHHVKIYQPYGGQYKFITNCDEDDIGNIDNLPPTGDKLIIKKSYKDHRVIRNAEYENVIWLMNEGIIPSDYILLNLLSRFKKIMIFFDNDYIGIKMGYKLVNHLKLLSNGNNIIELKYLPITQRWKDPAKYINREGRMRLHKILKQINL